MARHFTQAAKFRDFNLSAVTSEHEAFLILTEFAFGHREIFACPHCGVIGKHYLRKTRKQFRCRDCDAYFSPTSNTAFHKRKIPCMKLLQAIVMYVTGSNGEAAGRAAAVLGVDPKTAWLLFSKIREAFVFTWDTRPMEGVVQADGGHFCGKPHRANRRKKLDSVAVNARLRSRKAAIDPTIKRAHMESWNKEKLKKRRVVLAIRQVSVEPGSGAVRSTVAILKQEVAASVFPAVKAAVKPGSRIMTDSGTAFSPLIAEFDLEMVNHTREYSTLDGVNNNQAESFMSRLRRGEYGVFRGMRPNYFLDYCIEMCWREDYRRSTIRQRMQDLFKRIRQCGPSPSFAGYFQGTRRAVEWTTPGRRNSTAPG
ncbi:IS1595 family transposase [Paucibacter soli]|uniref:IS1595 family transposase n=1 Tax=Paucibacter soli TaxID=3133433 RepID=UPI0030AE186C